MAVLLLTGFIALRFVGSLKVGLPTLIAGALVASGFRLMNPSPSRVWIITAFGQKTEIIERRMAMTLPPLIDRVEISLEKKDHNFNTKKPIRCADGTYLEEGKSFISTSLVPDDSDDPDYPMNPYSRSAGRKLSDFDNAGRMDGAISIADDLFTMYLELIANEPERTAQWMETHAADIAADLESRIQGRPVRRSLITSAQGLESLQAMRDSRRQNGHGTDTNEQDDTRGIGITFTKFAPVLRQPQKVIDASNEHQVELMQQIAELTDTQTLDKQIEERLGHWEKTHIKGHEPRPSYETVRNWILEERLARDGNYVRIDNRGGVNFINAPQPTQTP